ncbi:MAG: 2,3,4,5-tetrahydropyridine-2,6-dicarboxylate N-succinyltransferase, partial [Pseudomonadota bacterium]
MDTAWDQRDELDDPDIRTPELEDAVRDALSMLDSGEARVASREGGGDWVVHQWLKKAVLLSFRLTDNEVIKDGPGGSAWYDKVSPKFSGWTEEDFVKGGFRAVPHAMVRYGSFIAPGAVLMPSYVNIG